MNSRPLVAGDIVITGGTLIKEEALRRYQAQKNRNIAHSNRGAVLLIVVTIVATAIIFSTNPPSRFVLLAVTGGADLFAAYLLYWYRHKGDNVTLESTLLLKKFYLNGGRNIDGRTLEDILRFSDQEFEDNHDHIQWILPTTEGSRHNKTAPLLTEEVARALRDHPISYKVINRILTFYSLDLATEAFSGDPIVSKNVKWVYEIPAWVTPPEGARINHNYLRMTRFITFLKLIGKEKLARALVDCLHKIVNEGTPIMQLNLRHIYNEHWRPALG